MLAIEVSLTLIPLAAILVVAFLAGFMLRSSQLKSYRRKVLELEKEMLNNHADILQLQKEKAILQKQMNESKIPVIPLMQTKEEAEKNRQIK